MSEKITQVVYRRSPLTGHMSQLSISFRPEDMILWDKGGTNIQDALPYLSPEEREFLLSGITPEEWKFFFSDEGA